MGTESKPQTVERWPLSSECSVMMVISAHTDKKENQIFLIYREIQNGAVAKSCMTNGLHILYMGKYFRISSYIRRSFLIYDFATAPL
jgi:hypothetical protein